MTMPVDNDNQSLFILYQPVDLQWVTKVSSDLRSKYDYNSEIILVPLSSDLSQRTFVLAGNTPIKTKDIFDHLLNGSEISHLKFNQENQLPKYPEHSLLLVEYNNVLKEIKRVVWASNKYFDDIGTFASKRLRRQQLIKALLQLNKST